MTTAEIAKELGVSRHMVSRIEKRALAKLSTPKLRKKWDSIRESIALLGYESEVSLPTIRRDAE